MSAPTTARCGKISVIWAPDGAGLVGIGDNFFGRVEFNDPDDWQAELRELVEAMIPRMEHARNDKAKLKQAREILAILEAEDES